MGGRLGGVWGGLFGFGGWVRDWIGFLSFFTIWYGFRLALGLVISFKV